MITTAAGPDPAVIDTHVHVFRQGEGLVEDRRYTPAYDARPETLLSAMAESGVDRAVLVQPSFLGTDNRFLLDVIADQPGRFHGIAVVAPELPEGALADLRHRGILGIRLNLIGQAVDDFAGRYGRLVSALARQEMILQVQAEGSQWPAILPAFERAPLRVLVDHFGRTAPDDPSRGFEGLLAVAARNPGLWFKFSAPYRLPAGRASACAARILDRLGPERIVWGSDWPATQFEGQHRYADTLAWLESWIADPATRHRVLTDNPARLYRFVTTG